MPHKFVLERTIGTHKDSVQRALCPLTSTYSVVYLFPQAYCNIKLSPALPASGFHPLLCLERSERNGHKDEEEDHHKDAEGEGEKIPGSSARKKYGMYDNVKLTDGDCDKLKSEFPSDWEERVERLSEYITAKGDKYRNHLAVVRSWAKKDGTDIHAASPRNENARRCGSNPFLRMLREEPENDQN